MKAALIGNGIAASLTPAMHMDEGRAQGLEYRYDRFDTTSAKFDGWGISSLLDHAQELGYVGVNITHPFKVDVLDVVHATSAEVAMIGASNTVVFDDGKRVAHNTDIFGFERMLSQGLNNKSVGRVLLLGAGGAGASVLFGLGQYGVDQVGIYDRDTSKAQKLASRSVDYGFTCLVYTIDTLRPQDLAQFDLIINATPVGMEGHAGCPVSTGGLTKDQIVADIVYFPLETQLLHAAKEIGAKVIYGSRMAVAQATRSFELFTGVPADETRMLRSATEQYFSKAS